MKTAHEAPRERFVSCEHPTGICPLERLADSDDARQKPTRTGLRHDAATRKDEAEAGDVGCESDVHCQRHRDADTDCGTIDGGDDGLFAVEDPQGQETAAVSVQTFWSIRACFGVERCTTCAEIGARAECTPGAGDDDCTDRIVGIGAIERVDHLGHHRARECIELFGPIHRDRQNAVVDVIENFLITHTDLVRGWPAGPAMLPCTPWICHATAKHSHQSRVLCPTGFYAY